MTKFADELFNDLMREYQPALQRVQRPAAAGRRAVPRPVWAAAGTAGMAGAVAAGVVGFGGSPAYAVTQNPNGTLTVAVSRLDGVSGANARLRAIGSRVVVVPVRPGCPSMNSLPAATPPPGRRVSGSARGRDRSVTVDVRGVPAGDIALVAAKAGPSGRVTQLAMKLIKGTAPSCVSLPPGGSLPPRPGSGAGGSVARNASGHANGPGRVISGSVPPGSGASGAGR
ncbi:MAG TPA: hypothetical protein VKV80_13455 [Streptosporangiaceae bacterium]|nr:hypothetical protein [Streptosporangiaceae bacterium]